MEKQIVEKFIISKEDFKEYFKDRQKITIGELRKYYNRRKIFTEEINQFLTH